MTVLDVEDYAGSLLGMNQNTRKQRVTTVRSFIKFAWKMNYIQTYFAEDVSPGPTISRAAERQLSFNEIRLLVQATRRSRDKTAIQTLYVTGMRNSGLIGLKGEDLIPSGKAGFLKVTEKGYSRLVDLRPHHRLWQQLENEVISNDPNRHVFRTVDGNGLTGGALVSIVKRASKRAILQKVVTPHWLRHAHCQHALKNGAHPLAVKQTVGHARLQSLATYLSSDMHPSSSSFIRLPD